MQLDSNHLSSNSLNPSKVSFQSRVLFIDPRNVPINFLQTKFYQCLRLIIGCNHVENNLYQWD